MMPRLLRVLCCSVSVLAIAGCHSDSTGPVDGGSPLPPGIGLQLNPFISAGLSSPAFLTQPLSYRRNFAVEQGGRVRIIKYRVLPKTPLLDILSSVLRGGERGIP